MQLANYMYPELVPEQEPRPPRNHLARPRACSRTSTRGRHFGIEVVEPLKQFVEHRADVGIHHPSRAPRQGKVMVVTHRLQPSPKLDRSDTSVISAKLRRRLEVAV